MMTPVHCAANRGDDAELLRLLQTGIPANLRSSDTQVPLHTAAESDRATAETLRILLEHGAAIDVKDGIGRTPLLKASSVEKMRFLVENGADPFYVADGGYGLLSFAPTLDQAKFAVSLGISPNVRSEYGETPLMDAAMWHGPQLTRFLLASGADPNLSGWSPLMLAVAMGNEDGVRASLSAGESATKIGPARWSAWHICVRLGDVAIAEIFREFGIDIDAPMERGYVPLASAILAGQIETARWLLDRGASPKGENGRKALIAAASVGEAELLKYFLVNGDTTFETSEDDPIITNCSNVECARILIEAGADIDTLYCGNSLLHLAVRDGNFEMLSGLLALGANPNCATYAYSPLMYAVWGDEREMVRLLLDAGADPNYQECDGDCALGGAKSAPVVHMLLEAGAAPTLQDMVGETPVSNAVWPEVVEALNASQERAFGEGLYDAAWYGDTALVTYFLSLGANVNYRTSWEVTPLMRAATRDPATVQVLLSAGADAKAADYEGNNALHHFAGSDDLWSATTEPDHEDDEPLEWDVKEADLAILPLLLAAGADLSALAEDGWSALDIAALTGRPSITAALATHSSPEDRAKAADAVRTHVKRNYAGSILEILAPPHKTAGHSSRP